MAEGNLVKYETEHGIVELSPDIIRKYLVSGDASKVTHQEVTMFLALCKYQKLNPFLREAYLIKYSEREAATIVTGKDVFTKRAIASKACEGWEAGIIVKTAKGAIEHREGTFKLADEELVGGWAKVYRKDWKVPASITAPLSEYLRKKQDGTPMASWRTMPATMIRKVALVQALREAFPEDLEGMVSMEEMPVDDSLLSNEPIKAEVVDVTPEPEKNETKPEKKITKPQAKRMFAIGSGNQELVRDVMKKFNYEHSDEIVASDYDKICAEIEKRVKDEPEEDPEETAKSVFTPEQEAELDAGLKQDELI